MSKELLVEASPGKGVFSEATSNTDLSAEIARNVEKEPGDRIVCRRVFKSTYRCNWLAPDRTVAASGSRFIDSYRIRDSKFLRVTRENGQLKIEDLTIRAPSAN
jgi:hypothetical protein